MRARGIGRIWTWWEEQGLELLVQQTSDGRRPGKESVVGMGLDSQRKSTGSKVVSVVLPEGIPELDAITPTCSLMNCFPIHRQSLCIKVLEKD